MLSTPILQFGTSRFLQAHVDLFLSEALAHGEALGPVTVVQSSGDPARAARLGGLLQPGGYPVRLKGLRDGRTVDEERRVTSVARTLSTASDMDLLLEMMVDEVQIILSNTADAGFRAQPADASGETRPLQEMSFPGKLSRLLLARHEAGGTRIQVMPTELVQNNGDVLRELVLAASAHLPQAFRDWLSTDVLWVNSLVDRIVSEPLEPAGAVAEPYALWAIEDRPGLILPCAHPDVQVVGDLDKVARLKLFVLNLGHSWMVSRWLDEGCDGPALVRDVLADPSRRAALEGLYQDEVLPGFAAAGEGAAAAAYVAETLDRFANPFLDHALADIAQNHSEKLDRRIAAFVTWARGQGDRTAKPRLEAALAGREETA
ncbi:mannitol dehydrogenase family protein [Salipiger mangrovisoli]|uniref:Mannitol dehydrogenase family protein n=1 Tax=Salipiger mangrovisoli TaxID=2865933 RepID=A0ABR9X414_9RHOB|nr:mannitol dehydrogenase family protein [Salipiger mangrovisoli]MBE9638307.1 mannitol dehydrogenase family protein [Salipiger mangrovisoli]